MPLVCLGHWKKLTQLKFNPHNELKISLITLSKKNTID